MMFRDEPKPREIPGVLHTIKEFLTSRTMFFCYGFALSALLMYAVLVIVAQAELYKAAL